MVTLIKYGALSGGEKYNVNVLNLDGLSTDTKPTRTYIEYGSDGREVGRMGIPNGSLYTEIDTGDTYMYDVDNMTWYQVTIGGGGGGGGGFTPTTAQLDAMNSGINSTKVAQITTNENNILLKANTSDVNTATASLQNQINQIAKAAGTGSADTEVAQARVGTDGTSYNTLKARLDAENTAVKTYISSVKDITEQAFENSIVMRQPELTFDYKHIDTNGTLKNNENKNLTSNMVLAVKNSNISVDAGYKYQYALYNKTTGTFIRRQTWLTSDTLTVLNDDYRIRVEISDIQESVLSDMSILTHLHTKIYSSTLPVTEYVAETEADAVRQSNNIVNTLGINTFRQKTMEVAEPTTYKSWPFVGVAGGKLLCLYSVGTSHTDAHSSIYAKYSDNGVIWSADHGIISTDSQRDNVTGKGYDEDGNLIFWVRRGNPGASDTMFELWKATDYKTFGQVSTPTFSSVHGHIGDIVSVPNVGLFAFWNSYGDSRSWGYVKSTDNGKTWTETTIETGQTKTSCPVEMSAVYLGNGKILVMGRQDWDGTYGMFQIQSDDYGETFTKYSTNIDYTGSTPSVLYDSESDTISMYCYLRYAGELRLFTTLSETVWNNPTSWTSGTVIATAATGDNAGNVNACQFGDIQIASFFSGNSTNTGIYATIV